MLRYLQVKNLALITDLELEFPPGMTVFTGETGAGKSILIEALGLALGDRADSSLVKAGCDQASVAAVFEPPAGEALAKLLEDQGIEPGAEIIVRRSFGTDGRSRAFVNGGPAPLSTLRALGDYLVDLHGQHEHHSLLKKEVQRELLDDYAAHGKLLEATACACAHLRRIESDLGRLNALNGEADREGELLRFQVGELRALQLTPEGIAELQNEHRRVANAGRLVEGCNHALALLSDAELAAQTAVDRATNEVKNLARLDAAFNDIAALLNSAAIQLGEAEHALRGYLDGLDADPDRVRELEDRIAALHDLARKHRVRMEDLPAHLQSLEERLAAIEGSAARRAGLEADRRAGVEDYRRAAAALHDSRTTAAAKLDKAVTEAMQQLGMPGGQFRATVEAVDEEIAAHGGDRIEFLVTANPGQPLRPLSKVASGGELSRVSLAIQVITAQCKGVPTLVFDEVDVGIGGRVAEIVGRQLRQLAQTRQVLCVTHLPQVAALGEHHLQVVKSLDGGEARIAVNPLAETDRVEEIARMLGGLQITAQTVAHARAMLKHSRN